MTGESPHHEYENEWPRGNVIINFLRRLRGAGPEQPKIKVVGDGADVIGPDALPILAETEYLKPIIDDGRTIEIHANRVNPKNSDKPDEMGW